MHILNRLTGWQRLWLVLAAIYAIPVVLLTYDSLPTQTTIDKNYAFETIDSMKNLDPSLKNQSTWQIREAYKDFSDREIVRRIHEKWLKKNVFQDMEFQEIDKRYKERSEGLLKDQLKSIGVALLFWFIPVIGAYILGWSVGWIYRGFRKSANEKDT